MGPTRKLTTEENDKRKQTEVLEKDATERELEKILFGDQPAFLASLRETATDEQYALSRIPGDQDDDEEMGDDDNVEEMADEDLFFLDAGTTDLPDDIMEELRQDEPDQDEERARRVLWHDSDDERLTVSLASHTRLRKLRDTEADDVVSGREYIRRLRRQYERLHPTPDWVKYARKKRKMSHKNEDEDSDSESDVSVEGGLSSSVKPLSEILRSTAPLTKQKPKAGTSTVATSLKLRPEIIDIQRLKDIASSGPSSVDTIEFHPDHPLLLTAGPSSTINLYHISPSATNPNPLVTSLHVKGTPITTATFATTGSDTALQTQIYFSARRRYFHTWSLASGTLTRISRPLYQSRSALEAANPKSKRKNVEIPTTEHLRLSPDAAYVAIIANTGSSGGVVHLLSGATHQPISQVRVDSLDGIAELAFYADSTGFSVIGKNGEVSEYNIAERRITARWTDEGAVGTTTLALGGSMKDPRSSAGTDVMGNNRWIAIGSTSGVVSVYDRQSILRHFANTVFKENTDNGIVNTGTYRPKPLRTFDHLTTPVSHLHFSKDESGQLLVMASRWKKNALRLVHMPSCTVYRNWPTDKTPLGRISSLALSRDGAYLAVGSEAGKVKLWQIRD